jgi:ketosteroid isomerase-like protein
MPTHLFKLVIISVAVLIGSCNFFRQKEREALPHEPIKKNWRQVEELKNVDREFSAYCRDSGMRKAYLEFLDDNGALLRPNHLPMEGANALDFLSQFEEEDVEINWEPSNGDVSSSGDLGYTYGIYTIINKKASDTTSGTYLMIWKKQKSGMWKLVMDSGNNGLAEPGDTMLKEKELTE